jgi:hypothetical protein
LGAGGRRDKAVGEVCLERIDEVKRGEREERMRRRDPVTAPPRKNVFMNASALQGPSKGGLPRPSEDEGILSTLTSGGSLLAPFEEEPTAPPEYPDVEKAIEESMESFHRVIAARYGWCCTF